MTVPAAAYDLAQDDPPPPPGALRDDQIEQMVLGRLLADVAALDRYAPELAAEDFVSVEHQAVFGALTAARAEGRPTGAAGLRPYLDASGALAAVGGAGYLAELMAGACLDGEVGGFARLLRDLRIRRETIALAREARADALDLEGRPAALAVIDGLQARLSEIGRSAGPAAATQPAATALDLVVDDLEAVARGEAPRGISTGLDALDRKIGRVEPGELWVIGARPGMGKSALAMTIALNIAERVGPAFFVSLEMPRRQLGQRIAAAYTGIPVWKIRRGVLDFDERMRVVAAAERVRGEVPLDIYADRDQTIEAVTAAARRAHRERPLAALFVDYLQLMRSDAQRGRESRVQELSDITGALKSLALELDIPVFALSQLNRGLENREDKRPGLADLRESGSIEQDADGVLMVFREELYHRKAEPGAAADAAELLAWEDKLAKIRGAAEIIVAKHRSGEAGQTARLEFAGDTTEFRDPPEQGGEDEREREG